MALEEHLEDVSKTTERLMNSAIALAEQGKVSESFNNAAVALDILKTLDLSDKLKREVEATINEKGKLVLQAIAKHMGLEVTIHDKNKNEKTS